jgi:Domain of unknown function (DUF6438)
MKILVTWFVATCIASQAFSQTDTLRGVWYSAAQDFLEFAPNAWSMEDGTRLFTRHFTVLQRDSNRLRFLNKYYDSKDNNVIKIDYSKNFDFILKTYTKDSLVLAPVSEHSRHFFNNREEIHFFRKAHFIDPSITFEKLVFSTTDCFGDCPIIQLEVDQEGRIHYSGKVYKDSTLTGDFTGMVSEQDMATLLRLLKNCQLKTLHWRSWFCCDAPVITLIVYFNGQRKYFKSMVLPHISNDLIDFLYALNGRATLVRTREKYVFEE